MEEYLKLTKESQLDLSKFDSVHVVVGNEACDLDSSVSALVYAYFLHTRLAYQNVIVLPLLNIPCSDFPLRTETTFVFYKHGIGSELLTFRDQIDLEHLHRQGNLKLTLVDFNVFRGKDVALEDSVVEVIDHHVRERKENEREAVTIEMVGSCASLISQRLFEDDKFELSAIEADILYSTILLDTVCLSETAGRTTPKDAEMIENLEKILKVEIDGRKAVFESIQKAKFDVSGLTTDELLRRDLKLASSATMSVAISSIPIHIKEFLQFENLASELQKFCTNQKADVSVVMSLYINEEGQPERQLTVFPASTDYSKQVLAVLLSDSSLGFTPLPSPVESVVAFSQGNVKASRKVILPLVRSHIENN